MLRPLGQSHRAFSSVAILAQVPRVRRGSPFGQRSTAMDDWLEVEYPVEEAAEPTDDEVVAQLTDLEQTWVDFLLKLAKCRRTSASAFSSSFPPAPPPSLPILPPLLLSSFPPLSQGSATRRSPWATTQTCWASASILTCVGA